MPPTIDQYVNVDKYHAPQWMGARAQRRFHVMAKPAGSACNLDCTYCFYLSKQTLPDGPGGGHMHDDVLERFVRDYIASVTGDEVVFSWQGGEPTLMGLDFFRKVVALQRKHAKSGQRIENDLQTNGTLLDEDWARFLKEHRFLVGLSIDGPRDIHDHYRITKRGEPTFDKVCAAAKMLRRFGVQFNTLTCVNRYNASRPLDVYRFLRRELGSTYLQFIPIVEIRGFETTAPQHWDPARLPVVGSPQSRPDHPVSVVTPWSVDPDEYGYFLSKVWDEWLARDYGKVLVNFCETLVVQHMGMPSQVCIHSEICGKGVAIEHDGSVYSCDHYVYPEYKLGNIAAEIGRRHGVLAGAGEVWLREVGNAARVLPPMRVPFGLLGRVPKEPSAAHARRRGRTQLPLFRTEAVLRARGTHGGKAGGEAARDAGAGAAAPGHALNIRRAPTRRLRTRTGASVWRAFGQLAIGLSAI